MACSISSGASEPAFGVALGGQNASVQQVLVDAVPESDAEFLDIVEKIQQAGRVECGIGRVVVHALQGPLGVPTVESPWSVVRPAADGAPVAAAPDVLCAGKTVQDGPVDEIIHVQDRGDSVPIPTGDGFLQLEPGIHRAVQQPPRIRAGIGRVAIDGVELFRVGTVVTSIVPGVYLFAQAVQAPVDAIQVEVDIKASARVRVSHFQQGVPHPLVAEVLGPLPLVDGPVMPTVAEEALELQRVEALDRAAVKQRKVQARRAVLAAQPQSEAVLGAVQWVAALVALDLEPAIHLELLRAVGGEEFDGDGPLPAVAARARIARINIDAAGLRVLAVTEQEIPVCDEGHGRDRQQGVIHQACIGPGVADLGIHLIVGRTAAIPGVRDSPGRAPLPACGRSHH